MNGVINVLKPPGMTSHDIVNFLRKELKIKKVGHGGTLDPAAAGVLPLFLGKATKAVEFFKDDDKEYIAEFCLGITTDTGDFEGNITNKKDVKVDEIKIRQAFSEFIGEIQQIPPMYSAVKYKGKKLYEYARQGLQIEREPRNVKIYSLDLVDFTKNRALVRIFCSKGTYIRTLCEDIGNRLGCGACLSCLVRVKSGVFDIKDSLTIEEIKEKIMEHDLEKIITPVDKCLQALPAVRFTNKDSACFIKGKVLTGDFEYLRDNLDKFVRLYNFKEFIGIAIVQKINGKIALRVYKYLK